MNLGSPATAHSATPAGTNRRELVLVAAMCRNRCIGIGGQMPWPKPPDGKHFVTVTTGHAIIMGRKTWDSIGRALPKRRNIVVTRQPGFVAPGAEVFADLDAALEAAWATDAAPRVIGGGEIYAATLGRATCCILTEVPESCAGVVFFPELEPDWRAVESVNHGAFIVRIWVRGSDNFVGNGVEIPSLEPSRGQ